jgi:hypothetical protein
MATASELPRGKPDGHNGTQALSRSLSPGTFGYSTFAYPVRYSYKRGARTFLFRPYPFSLLSGIVALIAMWRISLIAIWRSTSMGDGLMVS